MTALFPNRLRGVIHDDMSDVAKAWFATEDLFELAIELCYRPMTDSDFDRLTSGLRIIQNGLMERRNGLKEELEKV